jgi:hypothetical protein
MPRFKGFALSVVLVRSRDNAMPMSVLTKSEWAFVFANPAAAPRCKCPGKGPGSGLPTSHPDSDQRCTEVVMMTLWLPKGETVDGNL